VTTRVKICGIKTEAALAAALAAGADFIGLVLYPPSPRALSLEAAAVLARQARGRAASVALVVDAGDALIDAITADVAPDYLQLHGRESPERAAAIRQRSGRPVIKAISVAGPDDASRACDYRGAADLILFDAKPPREGAGALPGGNGIPFDWRHLEPVRDEHPFMLSGGLTPANVAAAIALTGADIVDVSSGVETAPGEKDAASIHAFIAAAKGRARPSNP
jgi:phosphoribosylanthranilate isomerase